MRKYIKWKILALVLLIIMPIVPMAASPATRERQRQLQQQLEQANRDLRYQQNLLAGTRHEMSQIMTEMQQLDQQMMDAALALESIELSILSTQIRIDDAEESLATARDEYDLQFEVLRERVRVMHEQGNIGMLEVLFQAESFMDFLTGWEHMRTLAEFDRNLLGRIEQSEARITSNIDSLSNARRLLEDLQFQQYRALEHLEFTFEERGRWFENLAEDEERMAELVAVFEEEQRASQLAFNQINAQLQREESEAARRRAAEERSAALARLNNFDGQFQWPIPTHSRISSPFGMRNHPILGGRRMHTGIDVPAPTGTRLIAAADGYVRFAGWSGGYGNTVIIDHGNGYSTLYAHNSRNRVSTGQFVYRGQHIADVGSTGMSTGPHLHFEIRINNVHQNPMAYFS